MSDQAKALRNRMKQLNMNLKPRTIAVISGKGGVGKSNFSLNFAITLANNGHSVLLFDMDIGMGNIDILLGTSAKHSIADFFTENPIDLQDMITEIPGGIHYIAGGTGLSQFPSINKESFFSFSDQFTKLIQSYEFIIFDMAAGLNNTSLQFILSVDEVIVITTPEPTSLTDAYSAIKFITLENKNIKFNIIVNRSINEQEGLATFNRLARVLERFLEKKVVLLGVLPDDRNISMAVRSQTPFVQYNEKSPASRALKEIVHQFSHLNLNPSTNPGELKTNFVERVKRFLFKR